MILDIKKLATQRVGNRFTLVTEMSDIGGAIPPTILTIKGHTTNVRFQLMRVERTPDDEVAGWRYESIGNIPPIMRGKNVDLLIIND